MVQNPTPQNQMSQEIKLKKIPSRTARLQKYKEYIKKYSLYSLLLVINYHEEEEDYMECDLVKKAIEDYQEKYVKGVKLPTSLKEFYEPNSQAMARKINFQVDEEKEKAMAYTIIKSFAK